MSHSKFLKTLCLSSLMIIFTGLFTISFAAEGAKDNDTGIKHRVVVLEEQSNAIVEWIMLHEGEHDDGGSESYIVFDSEGDKVGEFLGFMDPGTIMVKVEVGSTPVIIKMFPTMMATSASITLFTSTDCSGQAYIETRYSWPTWLSEILIVRMDMDWNSRVPAVPDFDQAGTRVMGSYISNGGCSAVPSHNSEKDVVPVNAVGGDLQATGAYPPPYELTQP